MYKILDFILGYIFKFIYYIKFKRNIIYSWLKSPNFNKQLMAYKRNNKKINIVFIDTDFVVGGSQKVTIDIVARLPVDRFTTVYIATECFGIVKNWKNKFIEVFDNFIDLRIIRNKGIKLLNILSFIRPNIVVIVNSKIAYSIAPKIKKKFPDIYLIDIIHGTFDVKLKNIISKECIESFDKRITVSYGLRDIILNEFEIEDSILGYEDKVICIQNGVDIQPDVKGLNDFSFRDNLNIPHTSFVVCFIGSIADHKDPLSVINMAKMAKNRKDLQFLIVGEGPLERNLNYQIYKNDLFDVVHYLGFSDDVSQIIHESNVLIMPSKIESMGLVILDAMVKGKPTIVANVGNQSEIIKNEINGYLVARDNKMVENFVNNIFRLMNDNNLYERIKNNALITVKKDFDVEISVKKYLNLFEELFLD